MSYSRTDFEEPTEVGERIAVGSRFRSWDEFEQAWKAYQQKHFSVYTVERSNPVGTKDRCQDLRYKSASYWCIHHAGFEPRGDGERPVTHTQDIGCTAYLYISRELRQECLIIRQLNDKHSHLRTEKLWMNYAQNRILEKTSKSV